MRTIKNFDGFVNESNINEAVSLRDLWEAFDGLYDGFVGVDSETGDISRYLDTKDHERVESLLNNITTMEDVKKHEAEVLACGKLLLKGVDAYMGTHGDLSRYWNINKVRKARTVFR